MAEEIVDEIVITSNAGQQPLLVQPRRHEWRIDVQINDGLIIQNRPLLDPLLSEGEYGMNLEPYVRKSAQVLDGLQVDPDSDFGRELERLHTRIKSYIDGLINGISMRSLVALRKRGSSKCRIVIHQWQPVPNYGPVWIYEGINRIHWELLEHVPLELVGCTGPYRFEVSRVLTFGEKTSNFPWHTEPRRYLEPLASVTRNPEGTFKVLLVLARQLDSAEVVSPKPVFEEPPASPDLGQFALMEVQRALEGDGRNRRLLVDVVRPGSLQKLKEHLKMRADQNPPIHFNLVHFDLHGQVKKRRKQPAGRNNLEEEYVPGLQFANPDLASRLHFEEGEAIAKALDSFRIENVVLNACWSALLHHGRGANLCEVFLRNGVRSVVGMWGPANEITVRKFLRSFYRALLFEEHDFDVAVAEGRAALRNDADRPPAARRFADDFIVVQYERGPPKPLARPRSLAPRSIAAALWQLVRHPRKTLRRKRRRARLPPPPPPPPPPPHPPLPLLRPGTSHQSSTRGRARSPRPPLPEVLDPPPQLIGLEDRFLRLELILMQYTVVFAHDTPKAANQTELEERMYNLADLWRRTSFVNEAIVHRASDFQDQERARPRVLQSPAWPLMESKTLYIVEGLDLIVAENQDEEVSRAVKANLVRFLLKEIKSGAAYVVVLTHMKIGFWESWLGDEVKMHWWTFTESRARRMERIPNT